MYELIYEFFKIGLFAIGGGMTALTFLYKLPLKYDWFTAENLVEIVAISEITPGPIAINMATFSGYAAKGILGGVIASISFIVPSVIIMLILANFIATQKDNKYVSSIFYGIRPAVSALILSTGLSMAKDMIIDVNTQYFINYKEILLFCLIFYLLNKFSKSAIYYIALSAFIGVIFKM